MQNKEQVSTETKLAALIANQMSKLGYETELVGNNVHVTKYKSLCLCFEVKSEGQDALNVLLSGGNVDYASTSTKRSSVESGKTRIRSWVKGIFSNQELLNKLNRRNIQVSNFDKVSNVLSLPKGNRTSYSAIYCFGFILESKIGHVKVSNVPMHDGYSVEIKNLPVEFSKGIGLWKLLKELSIPCPELTKKNTFFSCNLEESSNLEGVLLSSVVHIETQDLMAVLSEVFKVLKEKNLSELK